MTVECVINGVLRRVSLGRLPCRQGQCVRYSNVKYRDDGIQVVDIIVHRGRGFAEPWFLIVPPASEEVMPTEEVVTWYRWRMRIETTFRDFKSMMGVRNGLLFKNKRCDRMARMLICLAVAYMVLLALHGSEMAKQIRKEMEIPRHKGRHGTRRTLSALSIAILTLYRLMRMSPEKFAYALTEIRQSATTGLFTQGKS